MVLGCLPPFVVERGMRLNENKIAYADLHKTGSIEANCARDRLLLRKQKSVAVPRGARKEVEVPVIKHVDAEEVIHVEKKVEVPQVQVVEKVVEVPQMESVEGRDLIEYIRLPPERRQAAREFEAVEEVGEELPLEIAEPTVEQRGEWTWRIMHIGGNLV
ncbi:unnamed protein product [Symbiodinium natans]|uniref:Uncharacterized protein n=1 Tax=Symbiodinium natans TaxID=878477 RepID=A0A812N350_9DINO|nr:unnamed protein product [Symbiodinium natans]